ILGMNRVALGEVKRLLANMYVLIALADEMHFDTLQRRVVKSVMSKIVDPEIGAQFAIGAYQQIAIEGGRHARRVVIRRVQNRRVLDQVRANQQATAAQLIGDLSQKTTRFLRIEIANAGTGEKTDAGAVTGHARRQ